MQNLPRHLRDYKANDLWFDNLIKNSREYQGPQSSIESYHSFAICLKGNSRKLSQQDLNASGYPLEMFWVFC